MNLGCTDDPTQGPAVAYASCAVTFDATDTVCTGYSVSFALPPEALMALANAGGKCTNLTPPFLQVGRPGEGFSTQLDVTDQGRQATIAVASPDCTQVTLTITGKWAPVDEMILLAISPMGTRGVIVAVDLPPSQTSACDQVQCAVSSVDDVQFEACIGALEPSH